jgi:hypothetical protein
MSKTYRAEITWRGRWSWLTKKQVKISKTFTDEVEALKWLIAMIKSEFPNKHPIVNATLVTETDDE